MLNFTRKNTTPAGRPDLTTAPLFAGCTRREQAKIERLSALVKVSAGTTLTVEGSRRQELGVLLDGTATIVVDGERVGVLRPGDHYGHQALLASMDDPMASQPATIVTSTPQWVAVMSRTQANSILTHCPRVLDVLRRSLTRPVGGHLGAAVHVGMGGGGVALPLTASPQPTA